MTNSRYSEHGQAHAINSAVAVVVAPAPWARGSDSGTGAWINLEKKTSAESQGVSLSELLASETSKRFVVD